MNDRRSVVSGRAMFESGLIVGLIVAVVACGVIATQPGKFTPPRLTADQAQDIMRGEAGKHQETLAKFHVVALNGEYVRAVVKVPEEFTGDMPVDITYEYGWHLARIEPVRGKVPGPG